MLLRYLILFAFTYLVYRMFRSASGKPPKQPGMAGTPAGEDMVRDPNCNVYIPYDSAIKTVIKGETVYFCSKECEKEYRKK